MTEPTKRTEPAEWLCEVTEQIQRLADLEKNWDSYGAEPIDPKSIGHAVRLVEQLAMYERIEKPLITPTSNGHVGLEVLCKNRKLDMDIEPTGRINFLAEIEETTTDPAEIVRLLNSELLSKPCVSPTKAGGRHA